MSLQVWLPLDGDLKNQGLSDVVVTNNGATVNTSGKIGSCYGFNGTNNSISINSIFVNGNQNFSFCCWIKLNNLPSTYYNLLCSRTSSASTGISIWISSTATFLIDVGARWTTSAQNIEAGKWYHICIASSTTGRILYINGEQKAITTSIHTNPSTVNTSKILIGAEMNAAAGNPTGTYFNGYMNDFRLYDHALSAKEVKEISKGLILHYKLNDSYVESITPLDCTISNTAYNAANKKYGYNDDSNLIKTEEYLFGKKCIKIATRTSDVSAQPYAYFSNLFTSDGTNQPAYKALSFDYYTTVSSTTFLNIYKLGSGEGTVNWKTINSDGIFTGSYTNSSNSIRVKPNEWNHIEVVLHGTTAANAEWGYCINGNSYTSSPNKFFLFANIQLEENDHVTGYGANMHKAIIYDSSGYNYNGTITGTVTINESSSKYNISSYLNGSSYISTAAGTMAWCQLDELTLACWMKPTADMTGWRGSFGIVTDSDAKVRGFAITDYANSFRATYTNGSTYVTVSSGKTLPQNEWHHCAATLKGTELKLYFDGIYVLTTTINWGTSTLNTNTRIELGVDFPGTDEKFTGCYSDARIYMTALSAEDILELYNTSASIDKNGNIYAREVIEQ